METEVMTLDVANEVKPNKVYDQFTFALRPSGPPMDLGKNARKMMEFLYAYGVGRLVASASLDNAPDSFMIKIGPDMIEKIDKTRKPGIEVFGEKQFDKFITIIKDALFRYDTEVTFLVT